MFLKKLKFPLMFAVAFLTYTSCNEENINLEPLTPTEAAYFKNEQEFERGVRGTYAKLTDIYWFNGNNPIHGLWLLPGDDVTAQSANLNAFEIFGELNPGTGALNTYYSVLYQLLNRANTMLAKIDEAPDNLFTTPNLKNHERGEMLFLRAYVYFQLWNVFGTAPVITERIQTTDKITPPSSTGTQLLDQAITDLQQAATLLPASWNAANLGRATQHSANGLLGKALVFRASATNNNADYTAAIQAFDKITGRQLIADFSNNFSALDENNAESLFEFQASQAPGENIWLNNDFDNAIGSISAFWDFFADGTWYIWAYGSPYKPTQKLVNAFEAGDPRLAATVDTDKMLFRKYVSKDQKTGTGVSSVNNARILRYADVLLLKAEALVRSGGSTSDAVNLINQVRTRARNMGTTAVPADRPSSTDRTQIMEWIRQERFVELAAEEGHRWFDLRRWHLGGQINLANWNFNSLRTDFSFNANTHVNFPIPLNEVDLNPNITQNPGY